MTAHLPQSRHNRKLIAMFSTIFCLCLASALSLLPALTIDSSISQWVSSTINDSLRAPLILLTDTGKSKLLAVLTLVVAAGLWRTHKKREAIIFASGFTILALMVTLIKAAIARSRPEAAILVDATSGSFPSSHAALGLFFYGFGAILIARHTATPLHRPVILSAGFGLALGIAASRVLLNAHWLTDVVAGLSLGAIALLVAVRALKKV